MLRLKFNIRLLLKASLISLFCSLQLTSTQDLPNWFCDSEFCDTTYLAKPCNISKPEKKCANQGNRKYLTPEPCNCCPGSFCFNYLKEDDSCSLETAVVPDLCGPYQMCNYNSSAANYKCGDIETTPCMAARKVYKDRYERGTAGTAEFQPECTGGGAYAMKQCLPGSICFCASRQGDKLFGLSLPADISNCQCSKDIEFLKSMNFTGQFPRCLPNGDYDQLQCVGRTCFCLSNPGERKSLDKIEELPCWKKNEVDDSKVNPSKHLRLCEYKVAELEADAIIARRNGTIIMQADRPQCDYDGNFSPVQIRNNKYVCVDPQGNQIGGYETPVGKAIPDCNCARIQYLMKDIVNGRPVCCQRGNYRKWQCSGNICFCVDAHGKQLVDSPPIEVDADELEKLPCYMDGDECVESAIYSIANSQLIE